MIKLNELDIHITNKCNLNCIHCCFDSGKLNLPELSIDQWKKILEDGKKIGIKELDITGGEPLLYKSITQLIGYANSLNYETTLQTNGILFSKKQRDVLRREGLNKVMISVDGWETGYVKIRGNNYFKTVIKNIEESLTEGWNVRINSVAMKSNISSIPYLIQWAGKKEIPVTSIFYFTPQGRGSRIPEEVLNYKDWELLLKKLTNIAKEFSKTQVIVEPAVGPLDGNIKPMKCPIKNREYLQILCNGLAYPCTMLINSSHYVADLKIESLKECLEVERWEKYVLQKECNVHKNNSCFGGCIAYNTWYTDELDLDPRCREMTNGTYPVCPLIKLDLSSGIKSLRSGSLINKQV